MFFKVNKDVCCIIIPPWKKQNSKEIIKSRKWSWQPCPWWLHVNFWPQLYLKTLTRLLVLVKVPTKLHFWPHQTSQNCCCSPHGIFHLNRNISSQDEFWFSETLLFKGLADPIHVNKTLPPQHNGFPNRLWIILSELSGYTALKQINTAISICRHLPLLDNSRSALNKNKSRQMRINALWLKSLAARSFPRRENEHVLPGWVKLVMKEATGPVYELDLYHRSRVNKDRWLLWERCVMWG